MDFMLKDLTEKLKIIKENEALLRAYEKAMPENIAINIRYIVTYTHLALVAFETINATRNFPSKESEEEWLKLRAAFVEATIPICMHFKKTINEIYPSQN